MELAEVNNSQSYSILLRKIIQLFGEDQGRIPPKRRWPKLRRLRKSALNTFWFVLLPSTTTCFGRWWKRNQVKILKIERLNWICNFVNVETTRGSCQKKVLAPKKFIFRARVPPHKIFWVTQPCRGVASPMRWLSYATFGTFFLFSVQKLRPFSREDFWWKISFTPPPPPPPNGSNTISVNCPKMT